MFEEHTMSSFFKVVGHAEGSEQWKSFHLSKLQSLLHEVLSSVIHSDVQKQRRLNQTLFTAYVEDLLAKTHKLNFKFPVIYKNDKTLVLCTKHLQFQLIKSVKGNVLQPHRKTIKILPLTGSINIQSVFIWAQM